MRLPPLSQNRLQRIVSLLASVVVVSSGGTAASAPAAPSPAATPPIELEWQSHDPGCEPENVIELTLSSLGPTARPRHIVATAQVRREGSDWVVQLDTRSSMHTGRRILRSPSCADLRQALALLLAMILESEDDPDSVELPADATGGTSAAELRPGTDRAPEDERSLRVIAQAGGHYGFGLQPEASWGLAGSAGAAWRFLEASLRFTHWPMTRADIPESSGYIEVTRNDFALALCVSLDPLDWLSIVPCVAPKLTYFDANAVDTTDARDNSTLLPGVIGALDVRYWLPGQHLFLSLGSGVVWENPQPFSVQRTCQDGSPPECMTHDEPVHETPGVGGSVSLSIGARF